MIAFRFRDKSLPQLTLLGSPLGLGVSSILDGVAHELFAMVSPGQTVIDPVPHPLRSVPIGQEHKTHSDLCAFATYPRRASPTTRAVYSPLWRRGHRGFAGREGMSMKTFIRGLRQGDF